ncbi:SHOCT domain-containing protein [Candidatus Parcubacteria bacterium]|nr:MAG: SHOCT domain-containing protein [Candidatus Parcubacteria bacterium]
MENEEDEHQLQKEAEMHWMDWFGGGWIMMLLWWGLIIAGIVLLVKWITEQKSQSPREESALEILKKRYARGEITKEEFEQMKKDLLN